MAKPVTASASKKALQKAIDEAAYPEGDKFAEAKARLRRLKDEGRLPRRTTRQGTHAPPPPKAQPRPDPEDEGNWDADMDEGPQESEGGESESPVVKSEIDEDTPLPVRGAIRVGNEVGVYELTSCWWCEEDYHPGSSAVQCPRCGGYTCHRCRLNPKHLEYHSQMENAGLLSSPCVLRGR